MRRTATSRSGRDRRSIDAGLVCSRGGLANLDAAGNGRVDGRSVDIGAYERGAGVPTGIAVVGTGAPDELLGTAGDDIVCGMGGGDLIRGFGGGDHLDGGSGGDVVDAMGGPDRIFGGAGDDPCLDAKDGVQGNDRVGGGPGTDGARTDPHDRRRSVEVPPIC